MNILFICSATTWGGNEKWSTMAMEGLRENHQVFFLGKNPLLQSSFKVVNNAFVAPFKHNWDWNTYRIIKDICVEHQIELIISTKKKEYHIAGKVSRQLAIKHVIRLGIVRGMTIPIWSKYVYHHLNDGIVVNAQRIKTNLRRYKCFVNHPIHLIHNGIPNIDRFTKVQHQASASFTIISIGMLTKRKGFHKLIKSVYGLPDELKEKLKLYILGEGRERGNLEVMIRRYRLEKQVFLEGFCAEPVKYLQKADLFALISSNEGISNALLEGMATGVPVLTTLAGGASEFIENEINGFTTDAHVDVLSEKIMSIMQMSQDQLMGVGEAGRNVVCSKFSLSKMNNQMQTIVESGKF